jgi:extracellular factor (EF) 3-hydroxypalmitic acid methyl ester biosynthesis protein
MNLTDEEKYLLDHVHSQINKSNLSEALITLYDGIKEIYKHSSKDHWNKFISEYRQHHISSVFLQDPFIRRAFEKPRGYAGDAVMMDFIYALDGIVPPPFEDKELEIGKKLYYEFNRLSLACNAVRERRRILSKKIDQTSERVSNPYILSVACGHLREVLDSLAVKNKAIGKYVIIDQDKESLSVAAELIKDFGEFIPASVLDIIKGKIPISGFDFVYTAGLYDYLPDKISIKLTVKLFNLLNPGGRLLIANFLPNIPCIGFMEAVGDWWLIYRNKEQMQELISKIPKEHINNVDIFVEKNQNIIFVEIEKK